MEAVKKADAHHPKPLLEAGAMDKVSFGFEDVAPEEKTRRVGSVFSRVASRYALMNDGMSAGRHRRRPAMVRRRPPRRTRRREVVSAGLPRRWKDRCGRRVAPRAGEHILDMAGGTGDIAF